MIPTKNELLLELYKTQRKIFEHLESAEKNKVKEQILLDELKARSVDIVKEMPRALEWFMDSF